MTHSQVLNEFGKIRTLKPVLPSILRMLEYSDNSEQYFVVGISFADSEPIAHSLVIVQYISKLSEYSDICSRFKTVFVF